MFYTLLPPVNYNDMTNAKEEMLELLKGTVWFKDNTWAGRGEYDGAEWWEIHALPEIPKELLP